MKTSDMEVVYKYHSGSDLDVVNAARVSFDKESQWDYVEVGLLGGPAFKSVLSEKDAKLINYLAKHGHWTPFGHNSITLRIKAPLFVARQLGKHQVGFVWNEVSRRYVDDPPEYYMPDVFRGKAENVKQGSSDLPVYPAGEDGTCPNCSVKFVSNNGRQRYCSANCQGEHYRKMPWGWRKIKLSRLKQSAIKRGLEFSLVEDDIDMPVKCPYTGIELDYSNDSISDNSPSVDRILNDKGYVSGNVQVISSLANKMKSNASKDTLIEFAKNVLLRHAGVMVSAESGVTGCYQQLDNLYRSLIKQGVCAEQARMFLPQGTMVEWYWTGSLAAYSRVCKLRLDAHTQKETRDVAQMIADVVEPLFPVSWKALMTDKDK